jgi:predicted MFS family arabinose efflux permease
MLMPFSTAFTVYNLGIDLDHLPIIYLATGMAMIFIGPLVGRATDAFGRLRMFFAGTAIMSVMVLIYTNLERSTLVAVTLINVAMFLGIFSRMIPFQTLMTQVPAATHRGSFNAVSASLSQLAGGLAAVVSGHIVIEGANGRLQHYNVAGYVVVATGLLASVMMWRIDRSVRAA